MTSFDDKFDQVLKAWNAGEGAPPELIGEFSDDEAYTAQLRMLRLRQADGATHAGWKLGQTNRKMREERGEHQPAPGFLLASDHRTSGTHVDMQGADDWNLEPELALFLGEPLNGPNVTEQDVARAVEAVAPAMELVRPKKTWPDRALLRAVNGSTSGYILGAKMPTTVSRERLDDMRVVLKRNDETHTDVRAGDVNDNPLETIAWLANYLHGLGESLQQGQLVMAGSYAGLVPMSAGESWTAVIGDFGSVSMRC